MQQDTKLAEVGARFFFPFRVMAIPPFALSSIALFYGNTVLLAVTLSSFSPLGLYPLSSGQDSFGGGSILPLTPHLPDPSNSANSRYFSFTPFTTVFRYI